MKRQQLFHSFLPGFTVAVLTTQPAWATVAKMREVQIGSDASVLISANNANSFTNKSFFPNSQLTSKSGFLLNSYFRQGLTDLTSINAENDLNIEVAKILTKEQDRFVNFSDLSNHNFLAVNNSQFTNGNTRVSELLESSKCPQQKSQAALLLTSNTCLPKNTSDWIAQKTTPNTSEPSKPFSDSNVKSQISQSVDFTKTPNDLNPNPNPLLFPRQAEEVKIQATQRISLSEALELAKRNNNDLQVSLLQLQRSKSVLREAQAALFPSVDLSGDLTNGRDVGTALRIDQARKTNPLLDDAPANTNFTGTAQIKYDLYTSGRRNGAIQEAEEKIRVQEWDVERQSEEIRLNVSKA
ncbi:MAG: TolC family protein, partial [Dolichospermum sp.]